MSNFLLDLERDVWIAIAILASGIGIGAIGTVTVLMWIR